MLEILLAEDEPTIRFSVADALEQAGHKVAVAEDGARAQALIQERVFDLVITDIRMPKLDGMTLFRQLRAEQPSTRVILITGHGTVEDAVRALREGALDYLTKPFDLDEILFRVGRLDERRHLEQELSEARSQLAKLEPSAIIIGRSSPMVRLLELIETIADSDAPVLINGESGTGKELVARTIHQLSGRRAEPFVAVNCAAFPETLLETELFGHERGAFTGAMKAREGRFAAANGGTLLLDEIAEIPLPAQAKLLRVLQEGVIEPLGSNTQVEVNVRIVSATHRNLKQRIRDGLFREDLYYRLNVLDVAIPPLRERTGDLPLLVEHFLKHLSRGGDATPRISPSAWAALSNYPFPGNVRELEHAIQRAVVLSRGAELQLSHLPEDIAGPVSGEDPEAEGDGALRPLAVAIREFEEQYLLRALSASGGKKTKAAELLGISRKNLWEKLRSHGITDERWMSLLQAGRSGG